MNPFNRPDDFTPKELMIGAGINTALYNQWLYRNIFTANHPAEGPGTVSSYSFGDILIVALIVTLRKTDIRLKKASGIAFKIVAELSKWQKRNGRSDWPMLFVVPVGGSVKIEIAESGKWELAIRLDTDVIVSNIAGRIEEMGPV